MKLNRREGYLLALLAVTVIVAVLYFYVWQPMLAEQFAVQGEVDTLSIKLATLTPWQGREEELAARISGITAQIEELTAKRERGVPLPEFIVLLENSARTTRVRLNATDFAINDGEAVASVQFAGSYPNLYLFLKLLEEQDEALALDMLQLTSVQGELQGMLRIRLFSGIIVGEQKIGGFPERSPFTARRN